MTAPNGYEAVVAELRRVADVLGTLPPGFEPSYVGLSIHPGRDNDAASIALVDAVAAAVLGKPGETKQMAEGGYHHQATSDWEPVRISVFQRVPGPPPVDQDAEDAAAFDRGFMKEHRRADAASTGARVVAEAPGPSGPVPVRTDPHPAVAAVTASDALVGPCAGGCSNPAAHAEGAHDI